ncbi:hypothetical protein ACYTTR_11535, partial [Cobetia marina]
IERRIAFQSFGAPGVEKGNGNGFTPLPAAHLAYGETDLHASAASEKTASSSTAPTESSRAAQHRETTA